MEYPIATSDKVGYGHGDRLGSGKEQKSAKTVILQQKAKAAQATARVVHYLVNHEVRKEGRNAVSR